MHGYDIQYVLERYLTRGKKYQPDLILWLADNGSFYQLNELMAPLIKKYDDELKKSGQFEKLVKNKKYYPAWERGYEEVKKQLGAEALLVKQEDFLNQFRSYYSGKTFFLTTPNLDWQAKNILFPDQIITLASLEKKGYRFPNEGSLNKEGHKAVANEIFNYLTDHSSVVCQKDSP